MPGEVYKGPLPPLTEAELALAEALEADVKTLATGIGERNVSSFHYDDLVAAETFLRKSLEDAGYKVERQQYEVRAMAGAKVANLIAEISGGDKKQEVVVIGGHYDSVVDCPGANDNGSGTAATLALARAFAKKKPARTLRFVLFVNEEPPWFQTKDMGSLVYAKRCKERKENITAMLSLETIGYYSDEKGSQKFDSLPPLRLLYPDTGNFIAFVADVKSGPLAQQVVGKFRETTKFPAYGCALPDAIPGVGWSDHWSFWQMGYPGLMVTDTAPFRYPHYHKKTDTPDKIDFVRTACVVAGLERVVADLAGVK
ncbi:MAG: M28 family peptidase [Pirellulaceae bacterium]|nr:M28 family peptidase [Pirellulaceae bacterium]